MAKKVTPKTATKPKVAKAKAAPASPKGKTFTLEETLSQLKSLGNASVRAQNAKGGAWGAGAGDNQFGVKRGDIRKLADKIKTNHELALSLWKTGNVDAQQLATLLIDVKLLSSAELEQMVKSISFTWVADWLHSYVVKEHADKETLRKKWLTSKDRWTARSGWQLTAGRVAKSPDGLDLEALLGRIEQEMATAMPEVQWTMNACLAEIGIHFPKLRKRAIAIGDELGLYRDYPCSKGCTSPFAPIWINEMVKRQG
ncbi:DNA alkylation repair enzyme [Anatilimnocola aggregata]|uniref:DNA alkylation repair enzyme n=1 Tax=Anatilimnocola aggregata TaxID=2528021 RepID=A0A517Y5Y3_9BACT|nr:DNA alkylation repair protein [Anatilimnocola aggregata]QDU25643.1 DNA alkylation repair enzyme [Anatilimnocola aggregata]